MSEWDDWLNEPEPWEVPGSTAWMDGIRTKQDWDDRNTVMRQCRPCGKWTKQPQVGRTPCEHCGAADYDPSSTISLRTFNPLTAAKRKVKRKK